MKPKILILIIISCFLLNTALSGQKANKKIVVSGHVKDINGTFVSGAMILIDNQNSNVVTNDKGFYKVKVKPSAEVISAFTLMNSVGAELIEGRSVIDIVISSPVVNDEAQENTSDEETVNIGYGSISTKDLATPVNKIDGTNKIYKGYSSVYDMIGQVPGVKVNGKSIRIQGASSFMMSTEPLFVVDGVTVTSIDNIIPQTVKSIEVLKGPAASIYGSRGANGVILIYLNRAKDY
jgi:TonB-dependent SusC/RagA subfamily outer membrane receptor